MADVDASRPVTQADEPQSEPVMPTLNQVASSAVEAPAPADEAAPAQPDLAPAGSDLGNAEDDQTYSPEEIDQLRANEVAFSWQASEFVHHHKGMSWYVGLFGIMALLIAIMIFLQFWLYIGLFVIMAVAVVVYARKPPRVLTYELTHEGISVDGKPHSYQEFRSFGVIPDLTWHTIDLEPVQRLSPRIAILFDEQNFDAIIGHLELHLPRVDRRLDVVEKLSRYIRF